MENLATKLATRAKKAMMDPMMGGGAMPPEMGGQPMMPPDPSMMGGGAPVPSAEEIMMMQGGGMPGAAGMPMAPPMPDMPAPEPAPVDEGPNEAEIAQSEALAEMGKAVNNLTEALLAGQATLADTMENAGNAIMETPVGEELTPADIEPMIGAEV